MSVLNIGNEFNVWDKVSLNNSFVVTDGNRQFSIPKGSQGFVIQSNPLVIELYGSNDTLELTPNMVKKET